MRNPSAFYIKGDYHARMPVGRYELVVAKGPEYRLDCPYFEVGEDKTQDIDIALHRWENLPAKGW